MNRNRLILIVIIVLALIILAALLVLRLHKVGPRGQVGPEHKSLSILLSDAQSQEGKADLLTLKATYQRLISDFSNHKDIGAWQKKLDEINIKIIFSPVINGTSQEYEIQPLDTLTKISKRFNTTIDLLKKSNNFSSDRITPGKKIKISTGKFSALVDKSQNVLILKSNEEIIKTYSVATGTNNSTPIGTFKIINKLVNPVWYKAGVVVPPESPENILGSRWLGFELSGYGIHGTTDPGSIGKQATSGCVRMLNSDVEELYILLPIGTEVTIVD